MEGPYGVFLDPTLDHLVVLVQADGAGDEDHAVGFDSVREDVW